MEQVCNKIGFVIYDRVIVYINLKVNVVECISFVEDEVRQNFSIDEGWIYECYFQLRNW